LHLQNKVSWADEQAVVRDRTAKETVMQQLLRYGIVCGVALMIVLPPSISAAQTPQRATPSPLQEISESAAEALAPNDEIAAVMGREIQASVAAAGASMERLVEADRAGAESLREELGAGPGDLARELTELNGLLQDWQTPHYGVAELRPSGVPNIRAPVAPAQGDCDNFGALAACGSSLAI
jgi:hypothetical protein